jgi:nitric oxide reductase subunit C
MFKLWIALFIVFVIYTGLVYNFCDKRDREESIPGKAALAGWDTWQEKNCQSCHQIYGLGGYMGPDLTNVASDSDKDEKYLRTFIKYGTGKMPNFRLNDTEVNNVVAFLRWVDKSGKSKVAMDKVTWSGNYNLDN